MHTRLLILAGLCAALTVSSCKRAPSSVTRDALTNVDSFELLSINPDLLLEPSPDQYYQWRLLGVTAITDVGTQSKLVDGLCEALDATDGSVMACFDPRHAIRVKKAGRVSEFVICFECHSVRVYTNGTASAYYPIAAKNEAVFDDVLRAASVPLAPKSKDAQKSPG